MTPEELAELAELEELERLESEIGGPQAKTPQAAIAPPSPWGMVGRMASDVGEIFTKDIPGMAASAYETIQGAPKYMSKGSFPEWIRGAFMSSIEDKSPLQLADISGRSALMAAGGAVTAPFPPAVPFGIAAGNELWNMASEFVGGQPPLSDDERGTQFRQNVVKSAFPPLALAGLGEAANVTRNTVRSKNLFPSTAELQSVEARMPDALATAHNFPSRRTAGERVPYYELQEGQPTFVKNAPELMQGVDMKKLNDPMVDPFVKQQMATTYESNLARKLDGVMEQKKTALGVLDELGANDPSLKISAADLNLDEINTLIKQRDLSAITKSDSAELRNILADTSGDFETVYSIIDPNTNQPARLPKQLTLTEANLYLQNVYDRLRQARVFDDAYEAKLVTDPSVAQINRALISGLETTAQALRDTIGAKAGQIIAKTPDHPILKQLNLGPTTISELNNTYHHLRPYKDAIRRYNAESAEGRTPTSAGSLNLNVANPVTGLNALGRTATEAITEPVIQARRTADAFARGPELLNRINQVVEANQPGYTPYQRTDFNPVTSGNLPAFGMAVTNPLAAMGVAVDRVVAQEELYQPKDPVKVSLNPMLPDPKQGFQVPRNLSMMDPQGVANMIGVLMPPQIAEPLLLQWRKVSQGGSKEQQAEFLGLLVDRYPDFPIQRGPITGLNSEFDIGDGQMRLFSFNDQVKWEEQINASPLEVDEKAQRVLALRRNKIVVPMNTKLVPQNLGNVNQTGMTPAEQYLYNTHEFQPREQTGMGSRRVE